MLLFLMLRNKSQGYVSRVIPQRKSSYITRNSYKFLLFKAKHNSYKNLSFPSTTIEWNDLDQDLRNSESYILFRFSILNLLGYPQIVFITARILWI